MMSESQSSRRREEESLLGKEVSSDSGTVDYLEFFYYE